MPDTARLRAARRLVRIEEDAAYVSRLSSDGGDDAERRAIALVAGVTRWRRWLDWSLGRYLRQPVDSLDAPLRQALRLGAFELLVEEKPAHAAVTEAVGVAKVLQHKGAAGVANAVLRKLASARDRAEVAMPASGDLADDMAVRFSHPTWMVRRWLDRWGETATRRLLESNNAVPRYTLRVNALRTTPETVLERLAQLGAEPELSRWSPDLVTVGRLGPAMGLIAEGVCAVQDEAAALVVHALDPLPGESVLDGAAAPGGKAIYTAERMLNEGQVVAVDLHPAKTDLIWRAAQAHGATIVEPIAADLIEWEGETFDRVLLDAPCSGTGVLGKRADLRWRRDPADLETLADLQDALLDAAAWHVRPGGLLVYSTCSLESEENEERVASFLDRHPNVAREDVGESVPAEMRTEMGDYQALPHVHRTDGAFASRFRRVT